MAIIRVVLLYLASVALVMIPVTVNLEWYFNVKATILLSIPAIIIIPANIINGNYRVNRRPEKMDWFIFLLCLWGVLALLVTLLGGFQFTMPLSTAVCFAVFNVSYASYLLVSRRMRIHVIN